MKHTPTIMVVDDNTKIQFAFHSLLEKESCIIIGAKNGGEALKKFTKNKPQAVFLDISLPDLNGLAVLQQLRGLNPSIPIIVISSIASKEISEKVMRLGAFACLEKPLSVMKIREVLNSIKAQSDKSASNNTKS
jgi:two-component system chemotaxis response regulator CheY